MHNIPVLLLLIAVASLTDGQYPYPYAYPPPSLLQQQQQKFQQEYEQPNPVAEAVQQQLTQNDNKVPHLKKQYLPTTKKPTNGKPAKPSKLLTWWQQKMKQIQQKKTQHQVKSQRKTPMLRKKSKRTFLYNYDKPALQPVYADPYAVRPNLAEEQLQPVVEFPEPVTKQPKVLKSAPIPGQNPDKSTLRPLPRSNLKRKLARKLVKNDIARKLDKKVGEDSQCSGVCQKAHAPVCGTNGVHRVSFINYCEFAMAEQCCHNKFRGWRVLGYGKCFATDSLLSPRQDGHC